MKSYFDLMIILSPPENISAMISSYKKDAAQLIGTYDGMHSKAHISIKNLPRQKLFAAEPALLNLQRKITALPPVLLTIDGFDYFNHGEDYRTIYAKIRSTPATTQWFKEIKKHLSIKEFLVPHITIVKNVHITQFNKSWPHFKNIRLTEPFMIRELTVLQRETFDTFAKWEILMEIPFHGKNRPDEALGKLSLLKPDDENRAGSQQINLF